MRPAIVTPEVLRDARARGLSGSELARELGVTQQSVSLAAKRHRIDLPNKQGQRPAIVTPEVLRDAQSRGLSRSELARELGVGRGAVNKAAKRHRVDLPKKWGPRHELP